MNETISLKDKSGKEIASLIFNPYDLGIIVRYDEFEKTMKEIRKTLLSNANAIQINNDGTGKDAESENLIAEMEQEVFKVVDMLLDSAGASKALFGNVRPFASVGGEFYVQKTVESIMGYVSDRCDKLCQKYQMSRVYTNRGFTGFRSRKKKHK